MLERHNLESEMALMEAVNDQKPRRRLSVQDTMAVPYRWVCMLRATETNPNSRRYGLGTGVLIGPRHVLTAAHVLANLENPGETVGSRLTVQLGRNGQYKPFEAAEIRGWQVHPQWVAKHGGRRYLQTKYDYGLVTLKKDVSRWKHKSFGACELSYWGAQGVCGAGSEVGVSPAQIMGQEAQVTGYPGELTDELPKYTLWTGSGRITFDSYHKVILHTANTSGGQSGGPVWSMRNGVPCLAGIHSAPGTRLQDARGRITRTNNRAALISQDVLRQLKAWTRTFAG